MKHGDPFVVLAAVGFAVVDNIVGPVISVLGGGVFALTIAWIQFRGRKHDSKIFELQAEIYRLRGEVLDLRLQHLEEDHARVENDEAVS